MVRTLRRGLVLAALASFACTSVPTRDRDSGEDVASAMDVASPRDAQQPPDDRGVVLDSQTPPDDRVVPEDTGVTATTMDTGVAPMDTGVDARPATDTGVDARPPTDTGVDVRMPSDTGVDTGVDTGTASCPAGQTRCSGVCVDLNSDEAHCGRCASPCPAAANARPLCSAGRCTLVCARSFGDCNSTYADGCEASLSVSPNCGTCGNLCIRFAACVSGTCTPCGTGTIACGTACVNTNTDVNNCGACGFVCPTPPSGLGAARCVAGRCYHSNTCDPQRADCDRSAAGDYEVNTDSNSSHCGACGNVCGTGTYCCNGACRSTSLLCPRC